MTNTNCLAGMRCPSCGHADELRIEVIAVAKVTDDGVELVGDTEWNDDSFCQCDVCDHSATVSAFKEKS